MQAAKDGKEIEIKIHRADDFDRHLDQENILWNWADYDYRIKPEPMEFWINVRDDGVLDVCTSKINALHIADSRVIKTIKLREVTDENMGKGP